MSKLLGQTPKVYVITVESDQREKKLIDRGPWYVHNDVFSLQERSMNCSLDEIISCKATFWIQAHGIPFGQMTVCNAKMLANRINNEVLVEDPPKIYMLGFLRLRVEINTSIPLTLGFWLLRGQTECSWISLKYEGLRRFCHICGRLGHAHLKKRPCNHSLYSVLLRDDLKYGAWLSVKLVKGPTSILSDKPASKSYQLKDIADERHWCRMVEKNVDGFYGIDFSDRTPPPQSGTPKPSAIEGQKKQTCHSKL